MMGFVSLVGAGPGVKDHLTLRALDRLERADLVLYDALVGDSLLSLAPRAQRFYVGKRSGRHSMAQPTIESLMIKHAREGKRVVRLKAGDPFVLGRGGEEALALEAAGVPYEVVPGLSSALAAPAFAGIPVTHRKLASNFVMLSGPRRVRLRAGARRIAGQQRDARFFDGLQSTPRDCCAAYRRRMVGVHGRGHRRRRGHRGPDALARRPSGIGRNRLRPRRRAGHDGRRTDRRPRSPNSRTDPRRLGRRLGCRLFNRRHEDEPMTQMTNTIITAQRLRDGAVVFLGANRQWVDTTDAARPMTRDDAEANLAWAREAKNQLEVVDAYAVPLAPSEGAIVP